MALAIVIGGAALWSWQRGANERYVRNLVALSYEYSGYDGTPPDGLVYDRETFGPLGCSDQLRADEKWRGETSDQWGFPGGPGLVAAETAASRFEAEGWSVSRWVRESPLGNVHRVTAERLDDAVLLIFQNDGVSAGVSSGPCNRYTQINDPTPTRLWREVDEFD